MQFYKISFFFFYYVGYINKQKKNSDGNLRFLSMNSMVEYGWHRYEDDTWKHFHDETNSTYIGRKSHLWD